MFRKAATVTLVALASTGCALYSEVSVVPLRLTPANIERATDLTSMIRKADYLRAMELGPAAEARPRRSAEELGAIGGAFLAAGRLDDARSILRNALDLQPGGPTYAEIAWDLSQVEYLANNFDLSLEWAQLAYERGLQIKRWHLDYLEALQDIPAYRFSGKAMERVAFKYGRPDVPRIATKINGQHEVEGIIDSGAVLSIVSQRFANTVQIRRFGKFEGTFYGLLGEPIQVQFGLIDKLELNEMIIENVPVAIMPDEKMRFLINKREGTEFHMDFLLGSNLLKEFRLELDFDRRSVTFTRLTEADRRPGPDQNLFFHGFRPHVRAAVNDRAWFLFILDTGSEITFLNQSRLGVLPVKQFGGAHAATLQGLGGSMKHGAKLENVQVGVDEWGGRFKTIPMYSSDENETAVGIIGQNFLGQFNVVIDFGRMRVDLKRR